ncbi:MAG TPA: hypothetical protein PLO93_02920 [Candidatus Omnitrophota bacterium]|nr:hypothetical protein [Candidatus Omnitrophota bacterium]HQL41227.1 hypothetical protein [Candidatus Omnitrophota bacterium]
MKRIVCAMMLLALTGCMFIVREEQNVKSVGISKQDAQERIQALDATEESRKAGVWPFLEKNKK